MFIRLLLVVSYIVACIRHKVAPWHYFQLNANYFNEIRGIFSKLDMDHRIPVQWRLNQFLDTGHNQPDQYPVFVKPEWGQNSRGIERADNADELVRIRKHRTDTRMDYIIQEAAPGEREFEVFVLPSSLNNGLPDVLSITETKNSNAEKYPVNGIYNNQTHYIDVKAEFSAGDIKQIWEHLNQIGHFRIGRYCVRADSVKDLVNGHFHIIEINLFLPMPLYLLSKNVSLREKCSFAMNIMWKLARVTKNIPTSQPRKPVFLKKLQINQRLPAFSTKN